MIHRPGTQREGVTLLEVLTAIFIMGIGLLAILTLFPLGALSMARAVRDDRAATIAANAASMATALDLRHDTFVTDGFNIAPPGPNDLAGPSNLVFVDPAYVVLNGDPYMGGNPSPALPAAAQFAGSAGVVRVAPAIARNMTVTPPANTYQTIPAQQVARWFTFQDEIEFERLGLPVGWSATWQTNPANPSTLRRPGTYTWAYVIRRPRYNWPEVAEATVLVYASRNTVVQEGEQPYTVTPVNVNYSPDVPLGTSTIELTYTNLPRPNIRQGSWLLDITPVPVKNIVNGDFYKVASVADKDNTTLTIQLDRTIVYPWTPPAPAGKTIPFTAPYKAVPTSMVHLANVIAVVEKATTWNP
jgi:hypothetical protein